MRAVVVVAAVAVAACTPVEVAPPRAPAPIVPPVPDLHATAVPPGSQRVVLDAEPGPAEVSRVTSETEVGATSAFGFRSYRSLPPMAQRQTQLLCITPCVVDLPIGAHKLVFHEETADGSPGRSSSATIAVHGGPPMVVRHAIGNETITYSAGWLLGFVGLTLGIALTATGGMMFAFGATTKPGPGTNTNWNPNTFYAVGATVGGIGLLLDVTGILGIVLGRPHHQEGATTVFTF
jgi:hypothetical protein